MRTVIALATMAAVLFSAGTAFGDKIVVEKNKKTVEKKCDGNTKVVISGNKNTVTLKGTCASVDVSGNKNVVKLNRVVVLNVIGNKNTVNYWKGAKKGKKTKVTNLGKKNVITKRKDK